MSQIRKMSEVTFKHIVEAIHVKPREGDSYYFYIAAKDGMPVLVCSENGITTVRPSNDDYKLEHEYEVIREGRWIAVRRKCDQCSELQYYQRVRARKKLYKIITSCSCYDKERDKFLAKMKKKGIPLTFEEDKT